MPAIHPEFAPIALLSCLSLLLPLPWHWRARNVATLSLIFWLFVSNLIFAVDALVWGGNVIIKLRVWCDITTKFIIAANFALPAACLCISMHLERVASLRNAESTVAYQRRRRILEAILCFGFPLFFMCLHFVVQGHRFDIIEGYGCRPSTYYSIPSIFIVWVPPLLMAIGALVYSGIALRHFMMRRLTFATHLASTKSALTTSRYLRLMAMASVQMIWVLIGTAGSLWFTVKTMPIRPWTTWDDVHSDFGRIDQFLDILTPPAIRRSFYLLWWVMPISTWLFVTFFAFGADAMEEYRRCFDWVRVKVCRMSPPDGVKKRILSFVSQSSSTKPPPLPISKPTLYETTTSESFLPTYLSSASRLSIGSSTHKTETTLYSPTLEHHGLKPYLISPGKAIGSASDLTVSDFPLAPSNFPSQRSPPGRFQIQHSSYAVPQPRSPLSPPLPLTPPPSNPYARRLKPLLLNAQKEQPFAVPPLEAGVASPTDRRTSYPAYAPPVKQLGLPLLRRP